MKLTAPVRKHLKEDALNIITNPTSCLFLDRDTAI